MLIALGCGGCISVGSQRARVAPWPDVTEVVAGSQWQLAEEAASRSEGDFALAGDGCSMEPLFRPGTAVVVHPTSYFMLKPGQPVVYRNRSGCFVAHLTARKTTSGWVVIGLNNIEPDQELVTASNLVGVVRQAFTPAPALMVAAR